MSNGVVLYGIWYFMASLGFMIIFPDDRFFKSSHKRSIIKRSFTFAVALTVAALELINHLILWLYLQFTEHPISSAPVALKLQCVYPMWLTFILYSYLQRLVGTSIWVYTHNRHVVKAWFLDFPWLNSFKRETNFSNKYLVAFDAILSVWDHSLQQVLLAFTS